MPSDKLYSIPERLSNNKPFINSIEEYESRWKESVNNPCRFFGKAANEFLHWDKPFYQVKHGGFEEGDMAWFLGGELNASYNCVVRHALKTPEKIAIIFEGDEPGDVTKITFAQLMDQVCQIANVLLKYEIQKGDPIIIYMPMIPEAIISMLACAHIGAVHAVVFAGFSAESLHERIQDCGTRFVITANEGKRGGRTIPMKLIVDNALSLPNRVDKVLVYQHTSTKVQMTEDRDLWWHDELSMARPFCPTVPLSAEDPLFLLYTSGSTGTPKGILHTIGGYLLEAAMTVKYVFDCHSDDIFACMADIGWITGHSYSLYGPLALGVTTVIFESTPTYPSPSRFWQLIERHKITQFYTAPTAIRLLSRLGDDWVEKCDLSSVRVLGSVGEPINPEAWEWYYHKVGGGQCAIVDTYWQTETGSIIVSPLPGAIPTKPGSATVPFFGIRPVILDPHSGKEINEPNVTGVLAVSQPWPSMTRTVYNNHNRFMDTYLKPYPGYYFTGDGAFRDSDGYIWIQGRVDDVINVSGHRLSTAEIEAALAQDKCIAEVACIGGRDDLTGESIHAFCVIKPNILHTDNLTLALISQVRKTIGPFAKPKAIYLVTDLPKTRSGKVLRRILRKIVNNESHEIGDTSTMANPSVIQQLIEKVKH